MISIVAGKTKAGSNTTLADEYTGSTALNVSFRQSRVSPNQGLKYPAYLPAWIPYHSMSLIEDGPVIVHLRELHLMPPAVSLSPTPGWDSFIR